MRILVVLNDLDIGGAQNYTISLMNEFVKRGHNVSLRVLSNNLLLKERLNNDIEVKVWARKSKIDFKVIKELRSDIRASNYNAIISSHIIYEKIASFALKKTKTIYPLHSTVEGDYKSALMNFITFRFKRKNEVFLTSIDSQTAYLQKNYKLRKSFFSQIYNGVDTEKFTMPPLNFCKKKFLQSIEVDTQCKIILMIAGFRKEKRHIDAFNALKILHQKRNDVYLICVGDNRSAEKNVLQEYIVKNNIKKVKIFSAHEAGDILNYYWSADLFTLTSNKVETFPISVLEAMACGLPCVLTNTGGNKDIIKNEVLGRVVPIEDTYSIAASWNDVVNNQRDKKEIRTYVQQNYSLIKSVKEYLNLMSE